MNDSLNASQRITRSLRTIAPRQGLFPVGGKAQHCGLFFFSLSRSKNRRPRRSSRTREGDKARRIINFIATLNFCKNRLPCGSVHLRRCITKKNHKTRSTKSRHPQRSREYEVDEPAEHQFLMRTSPKWPYSIVSSVHYNNFFSNLDYDPDLIPRRIKFRTVRSTSDEFI